MATEPTRSAAAASLRTLAHSFAAHDADDATLARISETATELTRQLDEAPIRDRLALMRRGFEQAGMGLGFEDRAVGGGSNPTSVEMDVHYDAARGEIIADVVLGARSRAHPDARTAASSPPRSTTSPAS